MSSIYVPEWFKEDRLSVLQDAIDHISFGTLVTVTNNGLLASHIPMILKRVDGTSGTIQGHIARENIQWRNSLPEIDGLAMFVGPHAYISPSWYKSNEETGKVVPTWNFIAVHATGALRFITDTEWVRGLVTRLTMNFEKGSESPWKVSDAPREYIDQELKAVIGFELQIRQIEGNW